MIRSSHRCFRILLRTSFSLPQKRKPDCLKFRQPCSVDGKWRVDSLKFYLLCHRLSILLTLLDDKRHLRLREHNLYRIIIISFVYV
jgi:hypothetical protein